MQTRIFLIAAIATLTVSGAVSAEERAIEEIVVTAKRPTASVQVHDEIVVTAKRPVAPAPLDLAAVSRRALEAMPPESDAPKIDVPKIDLRLASLREDRG